MYFSNISLYEEQNDIFTRFSLRRFRNPSRVPRISNRVPRIRENYHRVPNIRENRVPKIREIGSLQIHTGYLTFSLEKLFLLVLLIPIMQAVVPYVQYQITILANVATGPALTDAGPNARPGRGAQCKT